jgi:uncharacterized protein YciI
MSDDRTALDAKMQAYGRERTTGFLLKDYFVVLAEPRTKNGDKPLPHLDETEHKRLFDEHIAHQLRLEESGQLFAAGPLLDEQGKRIGGLIILRADSFEDARRIVDSDPHRSSGLWDHTIHRWRVSEGSYTVRVKYSSKSAIVS